MIFNNETEKAAFDDLLSIASDGVRIFPSHAPMMENIIQCLIHGQTYHRPIPQTQQTQPHPSTDVFGPTTFIPPWSANSSYPSLPDVSDVLGEPTPSSVFSQNGAATSWPFNTLDMNKPTQPDPVEAQEPEKALPIKPIEDNSLAAVVEPTPSSVFSQNGAITSWPFNTLDIDKPAQSEPVEAEEPEKALPIEPIEDTDNTLEELHADAITPRKHLPRSSKPSSPNHVFHARALAALKQRRGNPLIATRLCRVLGNLNDPTVVAHMKPYSYISKKTGKRIYRRTSSYDILSDLSTQIYIGFIPGRVVDGRRQSATLVLPDPECSWFTKLQAPLPRTRIVAATA
ncbi:hypothetical protein CF319_g8239 [Tilletia indica]|nr:hypothetical protein CF319_g8239 [Tilletia indica]